MQILRRQTWPKGDSLAFAEALVVLALVRVALAVLNFKRIRGLSVALVRRLAPYPDNGTPETDAKLARSIRRAARLVPGARCLAQATAAMIITGRRGLRSRMTIGVKLGSLEAFGAHAWLETPSGVPVGGAEAAEFAPLMSVDPYA